MKQYFLIFGLYIFIYSHPCFGQTNRSSQQQEKRIALVIGNGNYVAGMPLANPENDAKAMKSALQSVGFTVMEYENLTQSQMKKAMDDFGEKLKGNDVGLFFYAGHGIQAKGYNYLIPVDATLKSEEEVEYDCVQADRILAKMESGGTKVNIIILDACRNNPFERSWTRSATGRGLAFMNAPTGSLIAYATSPGSTASDGSGNNGLYTSAILESIKIPNITIIEMFQNVRNIVTQKSGKQQTPWESTSLSGNFYFRQIFDNEVYKAISNSDNRLNASNVANKTYSFTKSKNDWKVENLSSNVHIQTINWYDPSDSLRPYSTEVKIFDVNGNMNYEKVYNLDLLGGTEVFIHENQKLSSIEKYNDKDSLESKCKVHWINKNIYTEYDNLSKDTVYLENGHKAKIIRHFTEPSLYKTEKPKEAKETIVYSYDKNGYLIMEESLRVYNKMKKPSETDTTYYNYLKFDEKGNWTKRIMIRDNISPPFHKNIQTAQYEYY
ncbi:MAG: caspase domain-containing protein [Bacteroidales bacterium]|jgi:hypothetical protein